jgi:hypothetical protein
VQKDSVQFNYVQKDSVQFIEEAFQRYLPKQLV